MAKKRYSFFKKTIISILLIILISGVLGGYWVYKAIYQSNVSLGDKKSQIIYIHTGSDFNDVMNMLYEKNIIVHRTSFEWLAEKKNYKNNIKPGKYRILARMSNNELINLLRAGLQEPVRITFTNIRTKAQLVSKMSAVTSSTSSGRERSFHSGQLLCSSHNSNNLQSRLQRTGRRQTIRQTRALAPSRLPRTRIDSRPCRPAAAIGVSPLQI